MSARVYVTIWCDNVTDEQGCVKFLETEHHTAKRARHAAAREGWLTALLGGRDLCPLHDLIEGARKGDDL